MGLGKNLFYYRDFISGSDYLSDQKLGSCPGRYYPMSDKISPIADITLLYTKCCFPGFLYFINCYKAPGGDVTVVCYRC